MYILIFIRSKCYRSCDYLLPKAESTMLDLSWHGNAVTKADAVKLYNQNAIDIFTRLIDETCLKLSSILNCSIVDTDLLRSTINSQLFKNLLCNVIDNLGKFVKK